ncbi:MAG: 2-oxo acid dehydrogenase subunit E2 [Bacilli bacterium]|nr:2-oxo acid dehydrogenase subunit E2 [Bacilli bacterium]
MDFVEKRKKKFGDRIDGHFVKDAPLMNKLMVGLYPNRCDCEVSSRFDLDITNLMNYIKARKEKDPNCQIKFFHCFIAAFARVINEKRLLLRFVQNKKIYERDEIKISFTAKRAFNEGAEESIVSYIAKKDDNVDSVTRFIIGEVNCLRDESIIEQRKNDKSSMESLNKLPNFVIRLFCWLLRRLDKHGWVPKSAVKEDPSFSTAMLANLGSIGLNSVYHHLNNYGSCSMMITIGKIQEREIKNNNGIVEKKFFVDVTGIFDERIADGFYFLNSMKLMQQYLEHPEVLEKPFNEEVKF